jgi:hypothetical protein
MGVGIYLYRFAQTPQRQGGNGKAVPPGGCRRREVDPRGVPLELDREKGRIRFQLLRSTRRHRLRPRHQRVRADVLLDGVDRPADDRGVHRATTAITCGRSSGGTRTGSSIGKSGTSPTSSSGPARGSSTPSWSKPPTPTIKEVDPEAQVLICSTAGIDTEFIKQVLAEKVRPFDALTVHPYRHDLDPHGLHQGTSGRQRTRRRG